MSAVAIRTLGGFGLSVNATSIPGPCTRKARALMVFLALHQGTDIARERLLEMFWPEAAPERARDGLKTALSSIRHCLRLAEVDPACYLIATRSTARWTGATVDVLEFQDVAASSDPVANERAMALYQGDFLEGDYDEWTVVERERLATLYESVLARAMRHSNDPQIAHCVIARNPYNEDAYAALIEAALALHRRPAAAFWVQRCREALAEIDERPSEAFETRFRGLVQRDVSPLRSFQLAPAV